MVFLRDFEARQAWIDEHKTGCLDIHNEEPGDSNDDTQYVTYVGAFTTQEHQNLVRDLRLKVESTSMHQFWSKWLAFINMNTKERRTWWLEWSRRLTIARITRFVRLRCCNAHHEELRRTIFLLTSADSAFHPNYCIRVTDVLEREMRLAYNTDSGSFSKKRKVGKHGHSSYLVAKTSIDAFYQQRPVSKPVVHQ